MHAALSPIGLLPMSSVRKDQENHCLAFCEDLLKDNKPELVVGHGKTLRGKPYTVDTSRMAIVGHNFLFPLVFKDSEAGWLVQFRQISP